MKVIIIEDEFSPRQMLRKKVEQHFSDLEIVAECENAEDALIEILRLRPDLIFLDIQMSGKNGLWLADELLRMKGEAFTPPDIIFTTGYTYSEYMLKAFELAALDYLVKPVNIENLKKAVARFYERKGTSIGLQHLSDAINGDKLLKLKSYNGIFLLRPEDIVYIEADHNYAVMFLTNGNKEDVFERLGEIEKKLPSKSFLRTGKSVIVNRQYIRKITDKSVQLVTPAANYTVEVSKEAIRILREKIV